MPSLSYIREFFVNKTDTGESAVQYCQRGKDQSGTWQVSWDGTGTFSVQLLGRLKDSENWTIIDTLTNAEMDVNDTKASAVQIFPQMKTNVTANSSTAGITSHLDE